MMKRLLALALCLFATPAVADSVDVRLFAPTGSPEPTIMCVAQIMADPLGPDVMRLDCSGMMPDNVYTVFLGQSQTPGSIPVTFLGQLTARNNGSAKFSVETEIVSAFLAVNPSLDAADGIADGIANVRNAGVLVSGANTVSLDYIRIYRSSGPVATVFGIAPNIPGGVLVATSDRIPD